MSKNLLNLSKKLISIVCLLFFIALGKSSGQVVDSLTTTLSSGNGQDGVMFNITPKKAITVKQFSTSFDGTTDTMKIYYKQGLWNTNSSSWTLLGAVPNLTGCSDGCATKIPINLNLQLVPGQTYGFYITTTDGGMNYTGTGTTYDPTLDLNQFSNNDVKIDSGIGIAYPFDGNNIFYPRMWNGAMYYTTGVGRFDVGVTSLLNPMSGCGLGTENLQIQLQSFDTSAIKGLDTIPIGYQVNGGAIFMDTFFVINKFDSLGDTVLTLKHPFNFSASGTYDVKVWAAFSKDTVGANDTLSSIVINPTITNFPFVEDFDGGSASFAETWHNAGGDDFDWTVNSGGTSSGSTGPGGDHTTGSGNYIYIETSSPRSNGDEAFLESPCIKLPVNASCPSFSFWYHMYGSTINTLYLEIDTGMGYMTVDSLVGAQQSSENDPYKKLLTDLKPYAGKVFKMRFRATVGSSFTGDIAIDDLSLDAGLPNDIGVVNITEPLSGQCGLTSKEDVTIRLVNFGCDSLSSGTKVPVGYNVNGGTIKLDTIILSQKWETGDTISFTFKQMSDFDTGGNYQVKAWSSWNQDKLLNNDTIFKSIINPTISNFPFCEDFENTTLTGPSSWQNTSAGDDYDWTLNSGNTSSSSTGPSGDHTTGNGNYIYIETSTLGTGDDALLVSPCFNSKKMISPYLEFWYHMYGAAMGSLDVEVLYNGQWINVFTISGQQQSDETDPYLRGLINLEDYRGFTNIRFRGTDGNSFTGDIALDDICVFDSCSSVNAVPPVAGFTSPDTIYLNYPTKIYNDYNGLPPVRHEWYLNGQYVSSEKDLEVNIGTPGFDTVMIVTENCGGIDTFTNTIYVDTPTVPPVTAFIADKNKVLVGDTVQLKDLSQYGPTGWQWDINPDFVGGLTAWEAVSGAGLTTRNPQIVFEQPGLYEVCLTPSNARGNGKQLCINKYIEVLPYEIMCVDNTTSLEKGVLFDDGGREFNYFSNQNCNLLIDPCASEVRLVFKAFDVVKQDDYVRIYDGRNANGTPLWNLSLYGSKGISGNIDDPGFDSVFVANSGTMYIEFESDGDDEATGFAAEWTSKPTNFTRPVAAIDGPDTICINSMATFANASKDPGLSFQWYVGQLGLFPVSTKNTFSLPFTQAGDTDIFLIVENCGGIDTVKKTLVVKVGKGVPRGNFLADNRNPAINSDTVNFTEMVSDCYDSISWSFSPNLVDYVNGTSPTSMLPKVVFRDTGCYDVTLIIENSFGTDTITKSCYINAVEYCTPVVSNLNSDVGITRVQLEDIDNTTSAGVDKYSDYTAAQSATLEKGGTYNIRVSRNTTYNKVNRKVWIDFNQDGNFTGSNELVAMQGSSASSNWTSSFMVPKSAHNGATRMRVGISYGNDQNSPCGPNKYGEFEDYRIVISEDMTAPVITLDNPDTLFLEACDSLANKDTGATAFDIVDGKLTDSLKVANNIQFNNPGSYMLTYTVSDSAGNMATKTRVVQVTADTSGPDIIVLGNNPDTLNIGNPYNDPGAMAIDQCDGQVNVTSSSNVDSSKTGLYQILYAAKDNSGNQSMAIRKVIVGDFEAPMVDFPGNDTITIDVQTNISLSGFVFSDNSGSPVAITDTSGTYFNKFSNGTATDTGLYTVTATFSDASGNTSNYTIYIDVEDMSAPVITVDSLLKTLCRYDTIIPEDNFSITDNFYPASKININMTGSYFSDYLVNRAKGIFQVKLMVTDGSGNTSSTIFYVSVVECQTAIEDQNKSLTDLKVYPNPNEGMFNLDLKLEKTQTVRITILNDIGKVIKVIEDGQTGSRVYQLNMSDNPGGIYFIRLEGESVNAIRKVIINK